MRLKSLYSYTHTQKNKDWVKGTQDRGVPIKRQKQTKLIRHFLYDSQLCEGGESPLPYSTSICLRRGHWTDANRHYSLPAVRPRFNDPWLCLHVTATSISGGRSDLVNSSSRSTACNCSQGYCSRGIHVALPMRLTKKWLSDNSILKCVVLAVS
jgi:hypothetical protein